jgi:hypothetical protein
LWGSPPAEAGLAVRAHLAEGGVCADGVGGAHPTGAR